MFTEPLLPIVELLMQADPIRDPGDFYRQVETASGLNKRLRFFIEEYRRQRPRLKRPLNVLDIGCGRMALLSSFVDEKDRYFGCDVAEADPSVQLSNYHVIDLNRESLAERLNGEMFDLVFCGEVIEHLFSPDALMADIRELLSDEGIVLLSTPNLGYWVNRLLLLFGISPLFLENSSRVKLGRRSPMLGQGNSTEGHIRLFTYRALREFVELNGFLPLKMTAAPVWNTFIDDFVCRVAPSLAPDLVFVLQKKHS